MTKSFPGVDTRQGLRTFLNTEPVDPRLAMSVKKLLKARMLGPDLLLFDVQCIDGGVNLLQVFEHAGDRIITCCLLGDDWGAFACMTAPFQPGSWEQSWELQRFW